MEGQLQQEMKSYENLNVDGMVGTTVYKLDAGSNQYMMAVVFRDRDSYMKNADSPEQEQRYQRFRALLEADPEWNDGEVIYSGK
jgi:antibiotic biosynthesis monooxygenase (ABM) superfamily enzyme